MRLVQNVFAPISIWATKIRAESTCTVSHVVTFQAKLKYVEKVSVKHINIEVHPTVNRHIYFKAFLHVFIQEIPREI
jgi:hypothetical protein